MTTWLVHLDGPAGALDDIATLTDRLVEFSVVREGTIYRLDAAAFSDLSNADQVYQRATEYAQRASQAADLLYGGGHPVVIRAVVPQGEPPHVYRDGQVTWSGPFIVATLPAVGAVDYDSRDLALPETRLAIVQFAPSLGIFWKLLDGHISLDALTWREFEELLADLLRQEGYAVTLGPGRSDGGKDLLAIKDAGPAGAFATVWQAKKLRQGNKVGVGVIRELADTRSEEKASKGIIATTTYLTRGALDRVQRDQHLLGKVDRDDLMAWIARAVKGR